MRRLEFHISKVNSAVVVFASVFLLTVPAQRRPTLSLARVQWAFN